MAKLVKVKGTTGNDVIIGGAGSEFINGKAGDDEVRGENGDDRVFGGPGDDTVGGGFGDDFVFGGAGNDTVNGGMGQDFLKGGGGEDRLTGNDGDVLFGQGGADVFRIDAYGSNNVIRDFHENQGDLIDIPAGYSLADATIVDNGSPNKGVTISFHLPGEEDVIVTILHIHSASDVSADWFI